MTSQSQMSPPALCFKYTEHTTELLNNLLLINYGETFRALILTLNNAETGEL